MPRMYRTLPYQGGDPRLVSEVVNNAMNGKTNNSGTVTLAYICEQKLLLLMKGQVLILLLYYHQELQMQQERSDSTFISKQKPKAALL